MRRAGAGIGLLGALLLILAGCGVGSQPVGEVLSFEDQGGQHLKPGDRNHPPYNSSPPTSGWHWEVHVPHRFMQSPIDPEIQVHELEHGAVLVQYACDNCPELVAQLWRLQRDQPRVIVAPNRRDLKARIVLTAWTKMLLLNEWDEARAIDFITRYGGREHAD